MAPAFGCTGRTIAASELKIEGSPKVNVLHVDCKSSRLGARYGGKQIALDLISKDGTITVEWRITLRNHANYLRQFVTVRANTTSVALKKLVLSKYLTPTAISTGSVDGSPLLVDNIFLGYEHPMSKNKLGFPGGQIGAWMLSQMTFPDHTMLTCDVTTAFSKTVPFEFFFNIQRALIGSKFSSWRYWKMFRKSRETITLVRLAPRILPMPRR